MTVNELWGDDWDEVRRQWSLDPSIAFLNHGFSGACPRPVLEAQAEWRAQMEARPIEFLDRRLPGLLNAARARVASFLNADADGIAFVPNATTGVAAVLTNVVLEPGDEILTTDHAYPAVRNAARRACTLAGATLAIHRIPLPLPSREDVAVGVLDALTSRTRLLIIDHVTSSTAAIFPIEEIVEGCRSRGVAVLVDAAHGPGMLDIDLDRLQPDYWTGNFHKWVCAPKGSAALFVAAGRRDAFRPPVTSHGYGTGLHGEFDWMGTNDPTAYLSVPAALDFMEGLGWERVRSHNHALVTHARAIAAQAMGTPIPTPDDAVGSIALFALPDGAGSTQDDARAVQAHLYEEHSIEVPVIPWNGTGYIRLAAQVYNHPAEYEQLANTLRAMSDQGWLQTGNRTSALQSRPLTSTALGAESAPKSSN